MKLVEFRTGMKRFAVNPDNVWWVEPVDAGNTNIVFGSDEGETAYVNLPYDKVVDLLQGQK